MNQHPFWWNQVSESVLTSFWTIRYVSWIVYVLSLILSPIQLVAPPQYLSTSTHQKVSVAKCSCRENVASPRKFEFVSFVVKVSSGDSKTFFVFRFGIDRNRNRRETRRKTESRCSETDSWGRKWETCGDPRIENPQGNLQFLRIDEVLHSYITLGGACFLFPDPN